MYLFWNSEPRFLLIAVARQQSVRFSIGHVVTQRWCCLREAVETTYARRTFAALYGLVHIFEVFMLTTCR